MAKFAAHVTVVRKSLLVGGVANVASSVRKQRVHWSDTIRCRAAVDRWP